MAHRYEARIAWRRGEATFSDNRYSRGHEWTFDGGVKVPASSSLSLAASRGFVVDSYVDEANGVMEKNAEGKLAITRITLRPRIAFSGEAMPDAAALGELHHDAHASCFIANSLKSEIVVEAAA